MLSLGEHGPFQRKSIFIIIFGAILCTFQSAAIAYLTKIPEFQCKHLDVPEEEFHDCTYSDSLCSPKVLLKKLSENSVHNWSYSFDLYCSKEKFIDFISTAFFLGGVLGSITLSKIPDLYGRKKPFQIMMVLSLFLHINLLFTIGPIHATLTFFVGGIAAFAYSMVSYIISEYLPPSYAGTIMGITNSSYPTFGFLTGIFFLLVNNWKIFFLITTTIHFFVTFYALKYFTESPRWLVTKGKKNECIEVMRFIASVNNTTSQFENFLKDNEDVFEKNHSNTTNKNYTLYQILSFKSQRKNFIILAFLWFSSCYCFYGIILNLGKMKGDFFALSIMAFAGEGICEFFCGILCGKFGRLTVIRSGALLGSVWFLLYVILPKRMGAICMFLSMGGYAISFTAIFIYTPEVFPTAIRGTCCNVLFLLSRFSPLFVSPLTALMGQRVNFVFISLGFINSFACGFLEETLGIPLSDEIPEECGRDSRLNYQFSN